MNPLASHSSSLDDQRVGAALRAVRLRRALRQEDVARRAGVSRAALSRAERGHIDGLSLRALRRLAGALDVRIDVVTRWRGGELERLLNARHSAMHETLARYFRGLPAWTAVPEVSFAVYGERGAIDILAWHGGERAILVIELKTDIVDIQELLTTLDRKRRLARVVARERDWEEPAHVSCWLIIEDTRTNRRRVQAHTTVLRSVFPADGRTVRTWLRSPSSPVAALSFWSAARHANAKGGARTVQRVRPSRDRHS